MWHNLCPKWRSKFRATPSLYHIRHQLIACWTSVLGIPKIPWFYCLRILKTVHAFCIWYTSVNVNVLWKTIKYLDREFLIYFTFRRLPSMVPSLSWSWIGSNGWSSTWNGLKISVPAAGICPFTRDLRIYWCYSIKTNLTTCFINPLPLQWEAWK